MASACGRWVIVFNGEIYNFEELRAELGASMRWRGRSDTEVLLAAFVAWGVQPTLERAVGMFSFAAYDRTNTELWLARDRVGKKPLYYGWVENDFVFASELSALRTESRDSLAIDRAALALLLRHNYIPAPHTIYRDMRKLEPGTMAVLGPQHIEERRYPEPRRYWSAERIRPHEARDDTETAERFIDVLRAAVKCRLISDVPLGAFLSGGIDSTLVCGVMCEVASAPVKTFTMGFEDPVYDEARYARQIANHLGTDHTEMYVGESDLLAAVSQLPKLNDEPFADSSLIPTYLLSRLARGHVTVALSGDGGDELFCGYSRYQYWEQMCRQLGWLPIGARRIGAATLRARWIQALTRRLPAPPAMGRPGSLASKLERFADLLAFTSDRALYVNLISYWMHPSDAVIDGVEPDTVYTDAAHWTRTAPVWRRPALQDFEQYLPDDILTKLDRASMGASLEARAPLLDHRVVEVALALPERMVRRERSAKWLLRQLLTRYVPSELMDRPKQGFAVPLGAWLRGPLRDWAHDLLNRDLLVRDAFFRPEPILTLLDEHMSGATDRSPQLWGVLMFQAWRHSD